MLTAVLEDFQQLPDVQPFTILEQTGERQDGPFPVLVSALAGSRVGIAQEEAAFREAARQADYTLVIAPECAGILSERCRWIEEVSGRSLNCTPVVIQLCGDKLALSHHLAAQNIPTPPCQVYQPPGDLPAFPLPWVLKPRDGAGSQATFLVQRTEQLPACVASARTEGWAGEFLLQPFVPGMPVSVAFLLGPRQRVPLLPAFQDLSDDGRFRYRGGRIPLPPLLSDRAVRLAERAVAAVHAQPMNPPKLSHDRQGAEVPTAPLRSRLSEVALSAQPSVRGYIGVDLVLGGAADGNEDSVIEINPRLTTSYVGLRVLARTNLAGAMLAVSCGEEIDPIWRSGSVHFSADGAIV